MHGLAKGTPGRRKAEEQLQAARDELMSMLLAIARDETQSANDRLKAITWALERAGFKTSMDVTLATPEWQLMLKGMFEGEVVDEQRAISSAPANPTYDDEASREQLRRLEQLQATPHPHWSDYNAPSDDPAVIEGEVPGTSGPRSLLTRTP